jgi:hypothetical protein
MVYTMTEVYEVVGHVYIRDLLKDFEGTRKWASHYIVNEGDPPGRLYDYAYLRSLNKNRKIILLSWSIKTEYKLEES